MTWLARLKKLESAPEHEPAEPAKGAFAGFAGSPLVHFQKTEPDSDHQAARLALFTDRGLNMEEAEELADRLAERDLGRDDRVLCIECAHLSGGAGGWRCSQWRQHQHNGPEIPGDLVTVILHRCGVFNDRLEAAV